LSRDAVHEQQRASRARRKRIASHAARLKWHL